MPRNNKRVFKRRKAFGIHSKSSKNEDTSAVKKSNSKAKLRIEYGEFLNSNSTNEIININLLSNVLNTSVLCTVCKNKSIKIKFSKQVQGLASELSLYCEHCDFQRSFLNTDVSSKVCNSRDCKVYELNTRLTYAMRSIGKGKAAAQMFCGIMNLPAPMHRFDDDTSELRSTIRSIALKSMNNAAKEAEEINDSKDIPVAIDGTWQRRGHVSMNGAVVATSVDSGKVLDVEVLSRFCKCKNKNRHDSNCRANFHGNSGAMESHGAVTIFERSKSLHSLRYVKFLGDGDSRAYKAVCEAKPYGDELSIEKLECIGHVEKRMGTRLRALKQKLKGKKLDDNKSLGGRGRLTEKEIDRLQLYYGLAIRNNTHNLQAMKQAVWATFFHKFSTDENPQHGLCPQGENTWCGYNRALLSGSDYKHKSTLPPDVLLKIKHVYQDLAKPELLAKCLHGKTQNSNESFNSILWSRIPKSTFVQLETLKTGMYEAVGCYNEGNVVKCKVLSELGITPGLYTTRAMMTADNARVRKAEYDVRQNTMEARKRRRLEKCQLEDNLADDPSNLSYAKGQY